MEDKKSPWLSIWIEPKATIASIIQENPNKALWWLAAIYGFSSLLNLFQSMALGNALGTIAILIIAVILAPIYGYVSFSVWSWFVMWVGKLFKGQGSFKAVRASYAWSCVPITINIPLWLLMVFAFGHQLFLNLPNAHLLSTGKVFFLFSVLIVKVILAIWSLVIYINALAEVQQYSILKAIFNIIVSAILLSVIFFIFWSFLIYMTGSLGAASVFNLIKTF